MSTATLTGATRLNTTGMAKGFRDLKKMVKTLRKDVAEPFAEAASALNKVVRNAALAVSALAGIGVKKIFDEEIVQRQFQMLGASIDQAKKRCAELREMGMENASTAWFSPDQWAEASLAMRRIGGEVLDNYENLRMIGDAAAKAGKPLSELSSKVAEFYVKLKAGKDIQRSIMPLVEDGLISHDALRRIETASKAGADFAQQWNMVTSELNRAKGAMVLLSNTGTGQLDKLKSILGEDLKKLFSGVADRVKDMVFAINNKLLELYNNGTLDAWAAKIAGIARDIANGLWRIVTAYQNLNQNTQIQLKTLVLSAVAAFAAWKAGLLEPFIRGLYGLTVFAIQNFKMIGAATAAFIAAYAGFKLGKVISDSLNEVQFGTLEKGWNSIMALGKMFVTGISQIFQNALVIVPNFLNGLVEMFIQTFSFIGEAAVVAYQKVKDAFTGSKLAEGAFDALRREYAAKRDAFLGDMAKRNAEKMKQVNDSFRPDWDKILKDFDSLEEYNKRMGVKGGLDKDEAARRNGGTFASRFIEGFKAEFSLDKMLQDFKDFGKLLLPDSVKSFLNELGKVKDIEFPKMPKLNDQLGTKDALKDIAKLNRNGEVLRGIYARMPKLNLNPAAAVDQAKNNKAMAGGFDKSDKVQIQKAIDVQKTGNFILERIDKNIEAIARKDSGAQWA